MSPSSFPPHPASVEKELALPHDKEFSGKASRGGRLSKRVGSMASAKLVKGKVGLGA
jgi:hypothetical protein